MTDQIIILIVLAVLVIALLRLKKHFKGGCCGSGGNTIRDKKSLNEPVIGTKYLTVEGMHCENCQIRVENALNRLDGVLCRVDLRKKTAKVDFSREVEDELLKQTVEKLGYQVTGIR